MPSLSTDLAGDARIVQLIEIGSPSGELTYSQVFAAVGDLDLSEEQVEALYELLDNHAISVVDDELPAPAAAGTPPRSTTPRTTVASTGHPDLDDALVSLRELFAADAALEEDTGESEGDRGDSPVDDALKQYMANLSRVPLLDAEEELRLARLMRSGTAAQSERARQQLVESNLRLVVFLARKYAGRSTLPLLDIVQEGNFGLMRAVERFNPERGHRLSNYATWWIRRAINRALSAQLRSMRLPAHIYAASQKLNRCKRELAQTLGREPSKNELAVATSMSLAQVDEVLRANLQPLSLDSPVGEDEDTELVDSVADPGGDTSGMQVDKSELRVEVRRALQGLSEREQVVIMKRFGLGEYRGAGPKSLEDIAIDMKLSRERVRQLEIRALRKLRRRSRSAALGALFATDDEG